MRTEQPLGPAQADLGVPPVRGEVCDGIAQGEQCGLRAVLDALTAEVAILDCEGRILAVNAPWRRFAAEQGLRSSDAAVGESYLAVCDAAAPHEPVAATAARGIRDALRGIRRELRLVYPCHGGGVERWFALRVTGFGEGGGARAVVVHEDVTDMKRAEEALHELTARLLVAQDEERRRIARDLHDGTAPNLVALSLELARLSGALPRGVPRELARSCVGLCEEAMRELRTVTFLLHPPVLERAGLVEALRWLADGLGKRAGIAVSVEATGAVQARLGVDVELALYRIVQEALTNVHRHTTSPTAEITLAVGHDAVRLTVADAGGAAPGWDGQQGGGVGIASMRERLRALGGRLEIVAAPAGTVVTAFVPRTRAAMGMGVDPPPAARTWGA